MSARVARCPHCRTWFGVFAYLDAAHATRWQLKQHLPPGKPSSAINICKGSGLFVAETELRLPRNSGEVCLSCGQVWPNSCDRDCPTLTEEPRDDAGEEV